MAQRNPIGIYHKGIEIVYFGRRRNGKDIPETRWVPVRAPAQRRLLEQTEDLSLLRYQGGAVKRRTRTDLDARKAAALAADDVAWLNSERQQALNEVLIDELNKLGASLDINTVEAEYLTKLAAIRA